MDVEPIPDEPAAVAEADGGRMLLVADYHAGIEAGLRREGIELDSRADERRERLVSLLERSRADHLVVLGDFAHSIGDPGRTERDELRAVLAALPRGVEVTVAKGNHDGDVESVLEESDRPTRLTPSHGVRVDGLGLVHGHTWPSPDVLTAEVVCLGHEHPVVRLQDDVGGTRTERAWLRGETNPEPFVDYHGVDVEIDAELVVFPAFNDLSGGTWINRRTDSFLSPFLPEGLRDGEAYLLDGTRLGPYASV